MSIKADSANVEKASWYVIRVHSGSEYKAVENIKKNAELYRVNPEDFVDFFIPSVTTESFKDNIKSEINKNLYPGYIMIKMKMNEKSWMAVVKSTKVSNFVGGVKGKPVPLSEKEYEKIVSNATQSSIAAKKAQDIVVGSRIKVKSGSFESFEGIVKNIDDKTSILTVSVSIFDRQTTIDLTPDQVTSINKAD